MERVLQGDCLNVLSDFEDQTVDLIYLDPPFFTNKIHKLKTRDGSKEFSYSDLWKNDEEYGNFLFNRLKELKRVLKNDGSIFVHCDKNSTHIVKSILDNIFGVKEFRSEIIWYYKRWSNSKRGLLPAHQTIYFYSKSCNFKFNTLFTDYSETTNIDQILQKRARDSNGKTVYAKDSNGQIIASDKKKGVPLNDVWDIPYLNPKAKERVGYPTQKPILLLEQIIEIASNEGDTILDPFCGSGTTLVAAKLKNRNVIGIDISYEAIELTKTRLEKSVKSESNLLKNGRKSYQTVDELVEKLLYDIEYIPVHRNAGIDAILKEKYQDSPILIRIQKKNETLDEAVSFLSKAVEIKKAKKSFLIRTNDIKALFNYGVENDNIIVIDSASYGLKKILNYENV